MKESFVRSVQVSERMSDYGAKTYSKMISKQQESNNNSSKQHLIYNPNTAIAHHHIKIKTEKELYRSGWKNTEIL